MSKQVVTTQAVLSLLLLGSFLPKLVHAQGPTVKSIIYDVTGLLRSLVPALVSVTFLVFIWGMVEYILQAGDQGAVDAGRNRMIAGVVGLFVIAAVWGLVQIVGATLDLGIPAA